MFDNLQSLGLGVISFAIVIGVGVVVLNKFASAVANCPSTFSTYNETSALCTNSTGGTSGVSFATTNANYLTTQLGTSGLAGWTPAIIALAVGLLFLGAFMLQGKGKVY